MQHIKTHNGPDAMQGTPQEESQDPPAPVSGRKGGPFLPETWPGQTPRAGPPFLPSGSDRAKFRCGGPS